MDNQIIEAIKSGKAHLQSQDRLRRMFFDNGQFEVWGQDRKWDRTHLMKKSPDVGIALKALLGEKEAQQ